TTLLLATSAWFHAQSAVPTPLSVIGWEPCADYKLATYEQIEKYFRALAAAAPARLKLVEMGKTTEGRNQVMAIVSSEANLIGLNRYKATARRLALAGDGDSFSDSDARALAQAGKAVVWIDFGLHSNEVAPGQLAPLLAFRAVTDESEEMRIIRDNVIFLLVPNMNPDGTTQVAEWYTKHRGAAWESRLPELWHPYAGHDDNRDWFMFTQPETRNSGRQLYAQWFPQIVYDQHQAAPFPARIFVPPFDDPVNPNIAPVVVRAVNLVGDAITRRLDREGKRGAISRVGFDTWWNGGMRTTPYFHNMVGILTETAHPSATPATNDPSIFPRTFANGASTLQPSTYYPSPYRGGEWHIRDSCDYMVSASLAVLDLAARQRQEWLFDIFAMGRDSARANAGETFLIPATQWDPGTAVKLVNTLRLGAVDVERATAPFNAAGRSYPAGSFVVRGAQPFAAHARDLLMPQVYPDLRNTPDGPPRQPYDVTGWTLPYQMGVQVDRVSGPLTIRTEPLPLDDAEWTSGFRIRPPAQVPDVERGAFVLDTRASDAFTAVNRLLKAGDQVFRTRAAVQVGGAEWPAGAFVIRNSPGTAARVTEAARQLGLVVGALDHVPAAAAPVRAPRIGVYHAWGGNMDEGWTRWVLEQFEFPYARVHDAEMRAGRLNLKFDVIVLPDAGYNEMANGFGRGAMPDEYVGGLSAAGVASLRAFAEAGGVLVAVDRATELPLRAFRLPVRNVTAGVSDTDFFVPGSLVRLRVDPNQPLAYGLPEEISAFLANTPAFALDPSLRERVVARYPEQNLLMSGWLVGERVLAGRAAVLDLPLGRGRVVLLGLRPAHRGQAHGTFKLLFNSFYLNDLESMGSSVKN
ncbi:MAG TPA: M14 family metallopeptidase, partial [Vicinamibacterales bacterium]